MATSSMVSGACIISGSRIDKSLLFTGVHAHSYSELTHVVALPYVQIHRGARLRKVVIDRGVEIPPNLVVGQDPELDAERFRRTEKGVCLITQQMIDRLRA
jgi:glucose-1-phosphate adenylyltransferase